MACCTFSIIWFINADISNVLVITIIIFIYSLALKAINHWIQILLKQFQWYNVQLHSYFDLYDYFS